MAFDLKKFLQGAVAQINPFDNGATFASVMNSKPKASPPPASTARPSLVQDIGRNLGQAAHNVASTRIPILGVSANEIAAQLPKAADTAISHTPLLGTAYEFGKRTATPEFQRMSLPEQVGQFASGIAKTGYDYTIAPLERTGGRIAATVTNTPQPSFSGVNLPVGQEIGQAAPVAGSKELGQALTFANIVGDALSMPTFAAGEQGIRQAGRDIAAANRRMGEAGFIRNPGTGEFARTSVHPDDARVMANFIDHARGITKLDPAQAQQLELDAARIAEHYNIGGKASTPAKLANAFDRHLSGELRLLDYLKSEGGYMRLPGGTDQPAVLPAKPNEFEQMLSSKESIPPSEAPVVGPKLTRPPQSLNADRLNVSEPAKGEITALSQPDQLTHMTDKEVQDLAKSSGIDLKSHTIDQTRARVAEQLNLRQKVVSLSNQADQLLEAGNIGERTQILRQIQELSQTSRAQGTDIARQLSARRIIANELDTPMQRIFKLLDKAGVNPDVVAERFGKVNFDDANEVVTAYRELVPPKASEWLDTVRYNSMLSSPLTQINNIFPNFISTGAVAPIEKTLTGVLDAVHSAITGKPRQFSTAEGGAYVKGYFSSFGEAKRRFSESLSGKAEATNLDTKGHVPMFAHGQNKLYDKLSFPMRLMEAMDGFFSGLTEGGITRALQTRQAKGIATPNIANQAQAEAAYRLYRQQLGDKSQGKFLQALDIPAQKLMELRNSSNPYVSYPAKFTVPFVRTTMNIFKQGFEYSPAGILTLHGAPNKTEQLSKMLLGTTVVAGAASLLGQGRLTWSQPTNAKQLEAWKAAGMLPYSVKIGNNWVSFQKLPPALSFNLALVAALDDAQKNAKINQNGIDNIIGAVAKYGQFLSDQSYTKSAGNFLKAVQGDGQAFTQLVSNYPQQVIPFRALSNWFANLTDDTQRKINKDASFAGQQLEALMQVIPGLRRTTTPVLDPNGQPVPAQHPFINAVSPLKISTEDPINADYYQQLKATSLQNANNAIARKQGQAVTPTSRALDASKKRVETATSKLPKGISEESASILKRYAALNPNGRSKFSADPANRFKLHAAQYEQAKLSGQLSEAKDLSMQRSLARESVTSHYSQDVLDFYALSKTEQGILFSKNPTKAAALYDQAKKLDAELGSAKFKGTTARRRTGKAKSKFDYSKRLVSTPGTGTANFATLRNLVKRPKISRKRVSIA